MTIKVERVTELTDELRSFLIAELPSIAELFDDVFDPQYAAIEHMLKNGIFFVGWKNGEIRGFHQSWLVNQHALDVRIKVLRQQIFYVKPDSYGVAEQLFQKFLDFGKLEANHIITMLTRRTNIKPETLMKKGFKEMEVLYRLEV